MALPVGFGSQGYPMQMPGPTAWDFENTIKQEENVVAAHQHCHPQALNPMSQQNPPAKSNAGEAASKPKRSRKRPAASNSASGEEGGDGKKKNGVPTLTELIDKIATEQTALRFDADEKVYEVVDGPAFEARFQELRHTRSKPTKEATARPFSRMHVHYSIVKGERWAGTGTQFKVKGTGDAMENEVTEGTNIHVTLLPSDGLAGFQVTLQHFLNVTGAGDKYKKALAAREAANQTSPSTDDTCEPDEVALDPPDDYWHSLSIDTVSEGVNAVWSENSKGDQAYFFYREDRDRSFPNGAIVKLVDGILCADDAPSERAVYMVVSDRNAKWKGEPLPSPEQERLGHWCCFLGQVPVRVRGAVRSGGYLGPAADGSGVGVQATPGVGAVVGIALESRAEGGEGMVRAMCFAGLNAMNAGVGSGLTGALEEGLRAREEMACLRSELEGVKREAAQGLMTLKERADDCEREMEEVYGKGEAEGAVQAGHAASAVGGKEVEERLMGGLGGGGASDLEAQSGWGKGERGVGGWTRWRMLGALAALTVVVVAVALALALSFRASDDHDAPVAPSPPSGGGGGGGAGGGGDCTSRTTGAECGADPSCMWAEIQSGDFAGRFACIGAPDAAPAATQAPAATPAP